MAELGDLQKTLQAALEQQQNKRMAHLENLQHRLEVTQRDRAELESLCREVDEAEQRKIDFKTLVGELHQAREALDSVSCRESELFTPHQYEATFERRLFRQVLGLDIKLTQDRLISVVFTLLDPDNPGRQFIATLDVSETGCWEVVSLDPHVHGVERLLHDLNSASGSITEFCKGFRRQCKQFILHHNDD